MPSLGLTSVTATLLVWAPQLSAATEPLDAAGPDEAPRLDPRAARLRRGRPCSRAKLRVID
jgi:hypothetical protein